MQQAATRRGCEKTVSNIKLFLAKSQCSAAAVKGALGIFYSCGSAEAAARCSASSASQQTLALVVVWLYAGMDGEPYDDANQDACRHCHDHANDKHAAFYPENGGLNEPKRPNQIQHELCEANPSPHCRRQFVFVRMHE